MTTEHIVNFDKENSDKYNIKKRKRIKLIGFKEMFNIRVVIRVVNVVE